MIELQKIPDREITFEPASLADSTGVVFRWEGRVYRAIRAEYEEFHRELLKKRNVQRLFDTGLVRTKIVPLAVDGYTLVLEHNRVPFTSYCMEWSYEMLRDAALLICDLSAKLRAQGMILKDVHPWNILFDASQPVFIDWGSIVPVEQADRWPYLQFRDRFILPIYLMSAGVFRIARISMLDTLNPLRLGDVFRLLLKRVPLITLVRYWLTDWQYKRDRFPADSNLFQSLRRLIELIPLQGEKTEWTGYDEPYRRFTHQPSEEWPPKIHTVYHILRRLHPRTVMDIGCNRGWFSELAARQGAQVIAIDTDEASINALYRRVRVSRMPILPLVVDICAPTPAHGIMHVWPSAQTRLKSDLVLALALTHHLVFKRGFRFKVIAAQLAAFAEKWLVVEFIPPEDYWVSQWMNEKFAWYKLENFIKELRVFFQRIQILDSSPLPRVLLLCEK